jgi:hypothetical protein
MLQLVNLEMCYVYAASKSRATASSPPREDAGSAIVSIMLARKNPRANPYTALNDEVEEHGCFNQYSWGI